MPPLLCNGGFNDQFDQWSIFHSTACVMEMFGN